MRIALLTASALATLLPSSPLLAQEAAADFENVYVDLDGAAVQISVALAAEACGLDEAAVQQTAVARLEESGLDPAVMQTAAPDGTAAPDTDAPANAALEGANAALADEDMNGTQATTADVAEGSTDTTSTEGEESMSPTLESAEATAVDTAAEETIVAPDASNQTVTTAQGTADPSTSEPGDEMLALAVCQIDVVRAAELGIPQANEIVTD